MSPAAGEPDTPTAVGGRRVAATRRERWDLRVDGVDLEVAVTERPGDGAPIVVLHGFGSTADDYADLARLPDLAGHRLLAYDAPGCGATSCADLSRVAVPFLLATARAVLDRAGVDRFHLVGHSMGGLTGLLLADAEPGRVRSFVDIEGNLAPEDCFLSRRVTGHTGDDEAFLADFVEQVGRSPEYSSALFAAGVRGKVCAGAVRGIFTSMVELSDHGDLLAKFLALPCPRMFVHGQDNAGLTYLPELAAQGVEVAAIPDSGHWPMYANAPETWRRLAAFVLAGSPGGQAGSSVRASPS